VRGEPALDAQMIQIWFDHPVHDDSHCCGGSARVAAHDSWLMTMLLSAVYS
jgi:hypothetical protein